MTTATETKPVDATALAIAKNLEQVQGAITEFDKIAAGFAELEAAHPANLACAVDTPKGMKEAIAGRAAWREPRIATEKARKAAKAPVLALGKDIDARAAAITLRLEAGEANYDEQIKTEEARREGEKARLAAAEAERIAAIQDALQGIRERATDAADLKLCPTAESIQWEIEALEKIEITAAVYQETLPQAVELKAATLASMRRTLAAAQEREAEAARIVAERAELTRLRAEQEARDKAERERVDAEQRVERERLAAERAALEQQQAAARAEQERVESEARALRQRQDEEAAAERRRADEQAREEREAADRAARASRAAEQARLDAEAAALRRAQAEAAAIAQRQLDEANVRALAEAQAKSEAQRRLQEAAPRLLAALKVMVAKAAKQNWNDQYPEELAAAHAAIDAAEGIELEDVPY